MKQAQPVAAAVAAPQEAATVQAPAAAAPAATAAPRPAVKPIGGFSLIFSVLWQTLTGWFRGAAK
jgi:hypothetical protein